MRRILYVFGSFSNDSKGQCKVYQSKGHSCGLQAIEMTNEMCVEFPSFVVGFFHEYFEQRA